MPPVFGPVSPSPTRLKSWAEARGTTRCPSAHAQQRHLRSDQALLDHDPATGLAERRPASLAATSAAASASESVTSTPLPAARPSVLTT